jgi:hypothetical protein
MLAGDLDRARREHALARSAAEKFDDPSEHTVFEGLYPNL